MHSGEPEVKRQVRSWEKKLMLKMRTKGLRQLELLLIFWYTNSN